MFTLIMVIMIMTGSGPAKMEWSIENLPQPICEKFAADSKFKADFDLGGKMKAVAFCVPG